MEENGAEDSHINLALLWQRVAAEKGTAFSFLIDGNKMIGSHNLGQNWIELTERVDAVNQLI